MVRTPRKSNEFRVTLGDVELPPEMADRIDKAIRRAVLDVIADLDRPDDHIHVRIPPEWRGLWLDLAKVQEFGAGPG